MKLNLTDLQISSLIVAFFRVLETKRNEYFPTSLIQDPFSSTILDSLAPTHLDLKNKLRANNTALDTFLQCIAIRTKFIDDWLSEDFTLESLEREGINSRASSSFSSLSNTENHSDDHTTFNKVNEKNPVRQRQIVSLNAGFCTRSYRLSFRNNFIMYEVDDTNVLEAKARILKNHHGESNIPVHHVHGDLRDIKGFINQLIQSGYDPNIPTDWIAESVIECLEPQDILQLLYSLKKISCLGSRIAIYWVEPLVKDYLSNILGVKKDGPNLSWKTFLPQEVGKQMLNDSGWSNVHSFGDEEAWELYRRAQNLPIFILTAEVCNVLKDADDMDRLKRIETRTNLYLDPSFVKSVSTL
jgi:methyltransferase (TIGR00027 family)